MIEELSRLVFENALLKDGERGPNKIKRIEAMIQVFLHSQHSKINTCQASSREAN
jgi:hypothetical protein